MFLFLVSFFFFKQKTAYEMRISDWSSDVCSSDLECKHNAVAGSYLGQLQHPTIKGITDILDVGRKTAMVAKQIHGHDAGFGQAAIAALVELKRVTHRTLRISVIQIDHECSASIDALALRSEERRVGKECVSPCKSRWSPTH